MNAGFGALSSFVLSSAVTVRVALFTVSSASVLVTA